MEFWNGIERNCDHRCHQKSGPCAFNSKDVTVQLPFDEGYYN